jgi:hypothetical protein
MKQTTLRLSVCALLAGFTASVAVARAPFEAVATTTGPTPITVTGSGSNLQDFVSSLINNTGSFAALNGNAWSGKSTFLGVPNAITFNTNAAGTSVTYGLSPIGFSKTFTGTSKADVDSQVNDFFEKNGSDTIAAFLKAIAKQSPLAVTDGNPNSATALSANSTFLGQGFTPADEIIDGIDSSAGGTEKPRYGGFGIGFNAGTFKAGDFKGQNYDFSISGLNIAIGDKARLVTPISLNYIKVEGAQIAGIGMNAALPIRFEVMNKDNPWNWRVTPSGGVSLRGSADLAGGALLWQAGVTNTVDYKANAKLVVCMINQLSTHHSIGITYGDYHFDPKVDQQIMKNGFRVVSPLTPRVIGDFFVVDSRFFKDAAVKSFETFGGSLSFRTTKNFNLSLGANYDTGTAFKAYSVGLSSAWRW